MERKALTCSQCGAPLEGYKCEYCGSVFEKQADDMVITTIYSVDNMPDYIYKIREKGIAYLNEA